MFYTEHVFYVKMGNYPFEGETSDAIHRIGSR